MYRAFPKPKLHTPSGQARVRLGRREIYLGKWGTDDVQENYERALLEHLARKLTPRPPASGYLVCDLGRLYVEHAEGYYTKHGHPTSTAGNVARAIELLNHTGVGHRFAESFGPRDLSQFQQWLALHPEQAWARSTINKYVRHVVSMFTWAVAGELVHMNLEALRAVSPLKRGRSPAPGIKPPRECGRVLPADLEMVEATMEHLPPELATMVRLQLLTGMRPAEVCAIRGGDVGATPNPNVFAYRVAANANKTDHHDIDRVVWLGPKAIELLLPWLTDRDPAEHLFRPDVVQRRRNAERRQSRETPMTPSQRQRRSAAAKRAQRNSGGRRPGDHYTTTSYGRAITRACEQAFPPPADLEGEDLRTWRAEHRWTPNQLRHNAATYIANNESLEVAGLLLGHQRLETTVRYVEWGDRRPIEAAAKLG